MGRTEQWEVIGIVGDDEYGKQRVMGEKQNCGRNRKGENSKGLLVEQRVVEVTVP